VSSIQAFGNTEPGDVDVYSNEECHTWAGGVAGDGQPLGAGVWTSSKEKRYTEYGPGGTENGRDLVRFSDGSAIFSLYTKFGELEHLAAVFADGTCEYDGVACCADDRRLHVLRKLALSVEVRPRSPSEPIESPPVAPSPCALDALHFQDDANANAAQVRCHRRWPSVAIVQLRPVVQAEAAMAKMRAGKVVPLPSARARRACFRGEWLSHLRSVCKNKRKRTLR
jgi:hypothetical protein